MHFRFELASDKITDFDQKIKEACAGIAQEYKSFLKDLGETDPLLLKNTMNKSFGVEAWLDNDNRIGGYIERKPLGREVAIEDPGLDKTIDSIVMQKRNDCIMKR